MRAVARHAGRATTQRAAAAALRRASASLAPSASSSSTPFPAVMDLYDDDVLNDLLSPELSTTAIAPPRLFFRRQTIRASRRSSASPISASAAGASINVEDSYLYGPRDAAAYARQLSIEEQSVSAAVKRYMRDAESARKRGDVSASRPAARLIMSWHHPLSLAIRQYKDTAAAATAREDRTGRLPADLEAARLIEGISEETLAAIAVHEVLAVLMRHLNGVPLAPVANAIGEAVRAEVNLTKLRALKAAAAAADRKAAADAIVAAAADSSPLDSGLDNTAVLSSATTRRRRRATSTGSSSLDGTAAIESKQALQRAKSGMYRFMALPTGVSAINYAAMRADVAGAAWAPRELMLVGTTLIDMLLHTAQVEVFRPPRPLSSDDSHGAKIFVDSTDAVSPPDKFVAAFRHYMWFNKSIKKSIGTITLHDAVVKLLFEDDRDLRAFISPKQQPMVVRPRPWISPTHGAYLSLQTPLVRTFPSKALDDALACADLRKIYDGLNTLGGTGWKVNAPVLHAAKSLWDAGGGVAGLVSRSDFPMPDKSEFVNAERSALFASLSRSGAKVASGDTDDDALMITTDDAVVHTREDELQIEAEEVAVLAGVRAYKRQRRRVRKLNRELYSIRANIGYQLDQASAFVNDDRIYLPHNVDFRGRAYPIPVYLQHMGADIMRSMLTFAAPGRELGKRGVYWLKVHLANKLGADKLSFDERVAVADDAMSRVLATAADPLADANVEWWSKHEDPFQLLAACHEFGAAVGRHGNETSMTSFHSQLPVSMDGSCNGLQHYAALGRDVIGGEQVNLIASDRPQDVYSGVSDLVKNRVTEAAAAGDPIAQLVDGKISRKVVKQVVMTSTYGVTLIGARAQVSTQLKGVVPDEHLWAASMMVAGWTLGSLGDIFNGATNTMDWLSASARSISQQGSEVQWLTPLGLPVIQPYRKNGTSMVRTVVQRVKLGERGEHMPISAVRQQSAFAPNFVHSIDSSHMLMTAMACRDAGLAFAAVHDSFWTHAADVDAMNTTLRRTFVNLHKRELLVELRDAMRLRHPNVALPPLPQRGDLNLEAVLDSPYFFS
jgi:DNA-directed RNA polymerase, mitochondrial